MKSVERNGFTLVEALVSIVLVSATLGYVWQWFGTAINTVSRVEEANSLEEVIEQWWVHMDLIDLSQQSSGKIEILEFSVYWNSNVERYSKNERLVRQPGWDIILYSVDVSIYRNDFNVYAFTASMFRQNQLGGQEIWN